VVCTLKLNPNIRIGEDYPENHDTNLESFDAYKSQESAKDDFIEAFEGLFVNFQRSVDSDLASSLNAFVALYKEAGTGMKRTYPKNKTSKTSNTPDWWDEDCSNAKYERNRKLRRFRTTNSKQDLDAYLISKKVFKIFAGRNA